MRNEEDPKTKIRLRIDNAQVLAVNEKYKGRAVSFFLVWGKKRDSLQFNEISSFEKWIFGHKDDKTVLSPFESRIVKMISQYSAKPNPVEYRIHPFLYATLKEQSIKISRPMSVKFRQTLRLSMDNSKSTSSTEGLATIMDTFAEIIAEMGGLQDRVDSIELLQEKLASILDGVTGQVGAMEPWIKFSQIDAMATILDKVDTIEHRIDDVEKIPNSSNSARNSLKPTQQDLVAVDLRLTAIEEKLNLLNFGACVSLDLGTVEKRLVLIEKQLEKQHKLEETVEQLTDKVNKLGLVCQKLVKQLKAQ